MSSISENSSIGYILQVHLEYSSKLHELHNDYPLAPEKRDISQNRLSNYCSNIVNEYGIKSGGVNKLVSNLSNKDKYAFHYRNLQLYLSLGMKLTKVHRILKFKKSDWLKQCINFSKNKRKNATNSFEKYFLKLMNNSVFGETMENLRKRVSIKLVNNAKDYVRCISKPSFVSHKIFSKKFVAIHEIKLVVILNKPIYVGILDLRKYLMYEFHYKYIKSKPDAKLLLTDTDSLVYEIKRKNVYEDFYQNKNLYDFNNYPLDSKFFDPANKKVIGKMVDEVKGRIISGFVG